ncbi:MAG: flagellar protein [Lachnospiraceae bacterium]|nr:flagellar protein [Lachnospiraceae bacterium]
MNGSIKNCRKCGKMFNYMMGPPICPACREKIEKKFQEVKEYVREHKAASMNQITEDCDVERKQVEQWVREERLVFSDESPIKLHCERCGAYITTGRFCDKCKKETANDVSAAGARETGNAAEAPRNSGLRMHTFRNN